MINGGMIPMYKEDIQSFEGNIRDNIKLSKKGV